MEQNSPYRLLVDSAEFWSAFVADAQTAQRRVYVQTLSFEGDTAGRGLADLLIALPAGVDRRVIIDEFTKNVLSDQFLHGVKGRRDAALQAELRSTQQMMRDLDAAGVQSRYVNPFGRLYSRFLLRNHKKVLLVDDRVAYMGGINFSEHNFSWHDLMLRIADPQVVAALADDFLVTWGGENRAQRRCFADLDLMLLDGPNNSSLCAHLFELLDGAREEIFIESPYLSFPFYAHLGAARRRGVRVRVIAPQRNNWWFYGSYTRYERRRHDIEMRLYPGRFNHLKAILIDNHSLVIGSLNFDILGYKFQQENIAVLRDPGVIADFVARVRDPDWAAAVPAS